ncbi:MAG: hypothetical protein RIS52_832, partial [Pseudomonadota bacterium]
FVARIFLDEHLLALGSDGHVFSFDIRVTG